MLHTGCHIPMEGLVSGEAQSHVGNTYSTVGPTSVPFKHMLQKLSGTPVFSMTPLTLHFS